MKIFEVVKKLVVWIYGSIPASEDASTRHHPSYKLSKKLGAISAKGCGLRLMEQKNLADYGIRKWVGVCCITWVANIYHRIFWN